MPCASACRAIRPSPTGSTATPPAASCSGGITRRSRSSAFCSSRARSKRPTGRSSPARPEAESGAIDLPLGRLDDTRGWWMKVDPNGQPARTLWRVKGRGRLARRGDRLARARAEDRPNASIARPLRRRGLADPRRCDLRRARRRAAAAAGAQVVVPLSKAEAADRGRGAGSAAHAGGAGGLRVRDRSARV